MSDPLAAAADLPDEDRERLAEMVERARHLRRQQLDDSMDEALGALPRLLRGPAKRIMLGGGS